MGKYLRVQPVPAVEQNEIDGILDLLQGPSSVAEDEVDHAGQPGGLEILLRNLDGGRVVFQRGEPATGGSRGVGQPEGGVAVGYADLEQFLVSRRLDDDVYEPGRVGMERPQTFLWRVYDACRALLPIGGILLLDSVDDLPD